MKPSSSAKANHPLLLVSVRNPLEAQAAIEGGAEIIDIKEPRRGSLGKADDAVIAEIARTVREMDEKIPISAALGELHEWEHTASLPRLPKEVGLVKLGLSWMGDDIHWKDKWQSFRERFESLDPESASKRSWVLVAYADWAKAHAPTTKEVIAAATSLRSRAVLIDTFSKDGRSLVEILPEHELADIGRAVHRQKFVFAVAGSLRKADLSRIELLKPEIVAIRSAACRDGNREGSICPVAVREFRAALAGNPQSAPSSV